MRRAVVLIADSLGIGGAPDAEAFGDAGADTLGHIAEACALAGGDQGPLKLPNLARLGLGLAARASSGSLPPGLGTHAPEAAWGYAVEISRGKDTPSGHWEMAGVPVDTPWNYFPDTRPCFPPELIEKLVARGGIEGVLGDRHASGTLIIEELGREHIATGKPIVYTSADSVFQIAAHETHFGLERLYALCLIARDLLDDWNVGRVIARPFLGEKPGDFHRTANRRDYSVPPPAPTLLDRLGAAGGTVHGIGKIADIFAHRGVDVVIKADGNEALFDATLGALDEAKDRALVIANLVDFDTLFGHRRDAAGYARALEEFDARLPDLEGRLCPGDVAVITADHGCDPTWPGTDHTRENVPVLAFGPGLEPRALGRRETFADIGQSLATHLGLAPLDHGTAFLP